ncbi:MAG: hypothetical protein QF893_23945 [Alphaproteobacteria bacterium]|jgi:predicted RNase H-like nuclease (RuvC/YqgF family)|nr:hypothetical protein [Alphaproteobacteria bacterium]
MDAVDQAIEEIRDRLAAAKAAIKDELRNYPQPITACDAQYNHLAEERRELSAEIARLDEIVRRGAQQDPRAAIDGFLRSSAYIDDAAAGEILAGLAPGGPSPAR